jgi:hypothetical protein
MARIPNEKNRQELGLSIGDCSPMKRIPKYLSKITTCVPAVILALILAPALCAQARPDQTQDSGTSTDLFIMLGSDFVRPGLAAKANYNIGIGHTFGLLKKDPFGDELTFATPMKMPAPVSGTRNSVPTRSPQAS